MWTYLRSILMLPPPPPPPPPTTIIGVRFPADGSAPHTLSLTTTNYGVDDGPDCFLGHVPDSRSFWKNEQAWKYRDLESFTLEDQPLESCNGMYLLFYSYDDETLPPNHSFPEAIFGRQRYFCGDGLVIKMPFSTICGNAGIPDFLSISSKK